MNVYSKSEKGLHLKNQDAFITDVKRGLFAVADGVTISRGDSGKASATAVEMLKECSGNLGSFFLTINERIKAMDETGTTTLTVALIKNNTLEVYHVGDSALFLVSENVRRITENDSKEGSNILTQVIGKGTPQPHEYRIPLKSGDIILLATDGVSRYVSEHDILTAAEKPENMPEQLINSAKSKKKLYEDDKTVIVITHEK